MRWCTIFLLYLYVAKTRGVSEASTSLRNYLADRMRYVNEEFSRIKRSTHDAHQHAQIHFGDSHLVAFDNATEAHTFAIFNRNYLLSNGELYYIAAEDNKYVLTSLKWFPEMRDEIAFIKTTDHNGVGYMFVSFVHDTVSHVYRFTNNTLQPRTPIQTIKNVNKLTDAAFFINHGSLYLVVSSVLGVSMAPVIVYKWEESHFDIIDKVYVDGAVGLRTFPNLDSASEIVIVLRNNELESSNSYVYEFDADKLSKIQILDDLRSTHLLTFSHHNSTFLVVFDNAPTSTLYRWLNNEFILLHQFEVQPNIEQVFVSIQDDTPLIFSSTKDELMVFTLVVDTIQPLRTHHFDPIFRNIFSMHISLFQGDMVALLLGLVNDGTDRVNFIFIPMSLDKLDIVSSVHEGDDLLDCMDQLDEILDEKRSNLDDSVPFPSKLVKMPDEKKGEEFVEKQPQAANRDKNLHVVEDIEEDYDNVMKTLQDLEQKSEGLKPIVDKALNTPELIVNSKVLIQGGLYSEKLKANSVRTKILNGVVWEPEKWLSTSGNQLITTPLYIDSLKVSDLEVHNDNGLFQDMLSTSATPNGNQTLFGVMRTASLKAFNIFAPQINDVDMRSLYLRRTPARITGNKSFNNVNATDVHADALNGKNTSEAIKLFGDPKALQYEFQPLVTVKNLEVETINDVDWANFSAGVFRIGGAQTIHGDVTIADVKTQFLSPKLIRGVRVEDLLTATTPQTVDSIVHFRTVHAPDVRAEKINGLDFANDVATVSNGDNTLISGPVTLKTMRITGNLVINGSLEEFYKQNHIVGTHERDLLQIYNNKVRINGDLHLANVNVAQAARLFINGNEFNQASFDDYWLKTTNQEIPVHFEAQHGIATPHLNTVLLNDIPIDDYMVNDDGAPTTTKRTTYVFENVTVVGNVRLDRTKQHQPDLQKLSAEAVRLNGTYVVRGSKKFEGKVSVEHLKAEALNNIKAANLLTRTASNIIGSKSVHNITVHNVNVNNLTMQQLNGINLEELRSRVVFIDVPTVLTNVDFENLTANHLFASKINNKLFNEYLAELNQLHLLETLNKLEIKGNASISKVDEVIYINNVNMPAIIAKMINDKGEPVQGNIFFDGRVHIKDLSVRHVNNIDVPSLVEQLYYRIWSQNVTAKHSFKYLHAPNVFTPQINNIRTTHLINVRASHLQVLDVSNGLRLTNPRFKRSLFANVTDCDVRTAVGRIHRIPTRTWQTVVVDNLMVADASNPLLRLLNHAVSTKKDNIISAPTSLHHVYADAVFNRKQINGIDLHWIVRDALTYNATDQVVVGAKEFVKLHATAIGVEGSTLIPEVNGIDVTKLDQSIVDSFQLHGLVIRGRKTFFGGVQTDSIKTPVASGINPDNLVSLANRRPIPKATFDDLTILNSMDIAMVNNVNFTQFLEERLLLHAGHDQITTANYYIHALQLNGKTTIPTINNIDLDDIVFDDGVQVITVPKKFTQRLEVHGDAIIETLNGVPVSDLYQDSILLQEEAHINGSINLLAPSQITGDIQAKSINGVPFEHINELLHSENHRVRIEIINDALHQIEGLVDENNQAINRLPHQYLYLERADDIQIPVENTHDVQVIEQKDGVLMHIHTREPGESCGLREECDCPNQQTVKIQLSKTHNFLDNRYEQRVYTYQDRDILIDVITNTKSRSKLCSSNSSQEYTTVNWYTFPHEDPKQPGLKYTYAEHIMGYISDVKFFSLDKHVYVILAKMYDKDHDTNELDSLVLRISSDNKKVEHVDKLKTNGASTLHIFHTAQGVNLVVGNIGSGLFYETLTTDIYTFDRQSKLFHLLRQIPTTGCVSATSVVLGLDSLIILAQKNSPVQVLTYNPFYRTYYFQENLLHDLPVTSLSVFYTGGFGSDAYLTAVTEKGHFYIYSYHYLTGWKLDSQGQIEGLTALVPFEISKKQYIFAPSSTTTSSLLTVVSQGV